MRHRLPGIDAVTYEVKTKVFEGPLDLLLQLITSHRLEITELSLIDLVSEYLAYLDGMRELDIDVTSEFLLIAATLIQLKARHLLPGDVDPELDDELALAEERDRLLSRLLACLTFKDVAAVMGHRYEAGLRYVPRTAGLDPDITPQLPKVPLTVTAEELARLADRVFTAGTREPDLDHLDLELPSVDDAIADIQARMATTTEIEFDQLVGHTDRSLEVVAYFLAVLELARWGAIRVSQTDWASEIRVVRLDGADPGEIEVLSRTSEWKRDE
jgi:segregation and condensation protein A